MEVENQADGLGVLKIPTNIQNAIPVKLGNTMKRIKVVEMRESLNQLK